MASLQPKRRVSLRSLDLRKTLFVLPNLITLASIFCGFNAIRIIARDAPGPEDFSAATMLLIFAMLFDLMDGRVARMTRTQSAFGLQLDSLADVISFGVAPALLVYKWVLFRYPIAGLLTAFLFVACGAARLARFNVLSSAKATPSSRPGRYILGLPIPPSAGVLISLVVANHAMAGALEDERYTVAIFGVTILMSLLMVSTVKFRSFKDLKLNAGTVLFVLFLIASSAFVWQRLKPEFVLVWLLSFYVLVGLLETLRELARKLTGAHVPRSGDPS
jgi:CDP-diacylglycerol---serine O-phosphatidyltransferase